MKSTSTDYLLLHLRTVSLDRVWRLKCWDGTEYRHSFALNVGLRHIYNDNKKYITLTALSKTGSAEQECKYMYMYIISNKK